MAGLDFLPLGSSYYPPFHPPGDWERDLRRMAEAGLNALRTAELIASWEWLEPERGRFDFSWLDRTFELARQYGLRILLGTGAGSPPIWLLDEYADVRIVGPDGVPYPTGARWGWACIDHPGFLAEAERYLRVLLARYGRHPALLGWQIHNEIGYPPKECSPHGNELYCYCPHTAARFREWLRRKYGQDIEALSEAWACTPTRHRYHDWAQVRPPAAMPLQYGPPGAWLDWRAFIDQHFAAFVAWQNQIIKSVDAEHPTTTNLIHVVYQDLGVARGVDGWLYPNTVDAVGFDMYPMDRPQREPFCVSLALDYARSPALHAGKPFWLPEIESGPIGGWVLGPLHATTARDIRRYDLEALGHGAKMILYQGYREWDPLPMPWGALVDLEGEPTERYDAARQIDRLVAAHEPLFLEAQPVRAQIAILWDQANASAVYGLGAHEFLSQAVRGVYEAFWAQGYPVEFITPELLAAGAGRGYRLLVLPFLMLVTAAGGRALDDFVARGGTLAAFARCAMLDHRGWYWHERPGAGLAAVFGVRERLLQRAVPELVPEPGAGLFAGVEGSLAGHWHRQDWALGDGVQVLARYADGQPAVTLHRHGAGQAIACGTHLDVAAHLAHDPRYGRVYANLAHLAGVERPFALESDGHLDGHLLTRGRQRLFIVTNPGPGGAAAAVCLPAAGAEGTVTDLLTGDRLAVCYAGETLSFDVTVPAWDGTALLVE